MYYFTEKYDPEQVFWFDKVLIKMGIWSNTPKALKAVLIPVLAHCDAKGVAYPGTLRVAILSGLCTKQAGKGLSQLKHFPGVIVVQKWTCHGKKSRKFTIKLPKENGFPIYTSLLHSGIWHNLIPTAKALYIVFRCYGGLPGDLLDMYADIEEIDFHEEDRREVYKNRKWEICDKSQAFLCEKAGIHRTRFKGAMSSLNDCDLISKQKSTLGYRIQVKPKIIYLREHMNKRIGERYFKSAQRFET